MNDTTDSRKQTIVLVHGAYADSSSWNGSVNALRKAGHPVIAAANRSLIPRAPAGTPAELAASAALTKPPIGPNAPRADKNPRRNNALERKVKIS